MLAFVWMRCEARKATEKSIQRIFQILWTELPFVKNASSDNMFIVGKGRENNIKDLHFTKNIAGY